MNVTEPAHGGLHELKTISGADLVARAEASRAERFTNGWGTPAAHWIYDPERLTLTPSVCPYYVIDLERINSAAELADWIYQLHGKAWVTAEVLYGFIFAIHDLLDPQANLCSWGTEGGPIDVAEIVRRES